MPSVPVAPVVVRGLRRAVRRRPRTRPAVDLAHPSRSPLGTSVVRCAAYENGVRSPVDHSPEEALARVRQAGSGFVWMGLHEPAEEEFARLTELFGLHPLAVDMAVEARQRPKVERFAGSMAAVFGTVRYREHEQLTDTSQIVETGAIAVFVGRDFVITVRHGAHGSLGPLRESLEAAPERLAQGPAAVLHAIADQVVDDYLDVTDSVQGDIDLLESEVFAPRAERGAFDTGRIYQLKRELLALKRAAGPLSRPLEALSEKPDRLIDAEIRKYFRDVHDHVTRATEQIAAFDALLDSILQASLAQITAAQNEGLRKVSAWVAVIAVPTMVCGIYGMNFDHMPELDWPFGYPLALVLTGTVCVLMYRAFRRNGWL
ncbi:magnesium and cobalt transport protein CorA [Streptomyces boncukensis]|uniref:Magnesium and cobalt transport protein CorA n=1 Tax=Streptomyces boncukensis TaxID=2711219 RepID=A0A6G4WV49_9ACTN|nr:magnesium and cobalt transport protein CorA [Streptomyces boncukensis]NGO68988.1 magnesium and cobalt transport protein CorA [Streptomyces boncukensis]